MSIKLTAPTKNIPAITLDRVQFLSFALSQREEPPYTVSVSAKFRLYGVDDEERRYYDKDIESIVIGDVSKFVSTLDQDDQIDAAISMRSVREGLGGLLRTRLGITDLEIT